MATHIQMDSGEFWLSDELCEQITATGGVVEPNTLYGIPIVMDEDIVVQDSLETPPPKLQGFKPCPATDATITLHGLTPSKSCPPIVTKRSELCPCGTVHPNGLRKPWKTCCGKGKT